MLIDLELNRLLHFLLPVGLAEPGRVDEQITWRLKDVLDLNDGRVLEHGVTGDEVVSMAERDSI